MSRTHGWVYVKVNTPYKCGLLRIYVGYDTDQYLSYNDIIIALKKGFREWLKTRNGARYLKETERNIADNLCVHDFSDMAKRRSLFAFLRTLGLYVSITNEVYEKKYFALLGYIEGDEQL